MSFIDDLNKLREDKEELECLYGEITEEDQRFIAVAVLLHRARMEVNVREHVEDQLHDLWREKKRLEEEWGQRAEKFHRATILLVGAMLFFALGFWVVVR